LIRAYVVVFGSLLATLVTAAAYTSGAPMIISGAMMVGSVGAFLIGAQLVGWLTNRTEVLRIDADGIQYGRTNWKWNCVQRFKITAEPWSNTLCVLLWTRRKRGPGRVLPTDVEVTSEDITSLIARASRYLESTDFSGSFSG
jgi:hypothetical protein